MSANALFRPTFADLRAEIERRAAEGASTDEINALVEQFLSTAGDAPAPWVEYDGTVTWFYRDPAAETVAVVGDILGYDPDRTRMTRLPGSDLFALTAQMPLDAWIEYAFVVDHARSAAERANSWLSLYTTLERPHVFGQALAQSPVARSFAKAVPVLLARNAARGFRPPQCYIDVGRYEAPAVLESVHTLCSALLNGGAAVSYQEFGGGHSFLGWRTTLPDALRFHFSPPALLASGID